MPIDRLSRQDRQLVPQFAVDILPPHRGLFCPQTAVRQGIQHAFHRNIARKIPQIGIAAARFARVPQQTVKQGVQIRAVDVCTGALVLLGQPCTAEKQRAGVGGKGRRVVPVRGGQCGQRGIEKRQVHI